MSFIHQYKPDRYTKLLLHFNGDLYDSSISSHTVSMHGRGALSTSYYKFGTHSLYIPAGSTDYISIPDSTDWDFGSNDFTIEMQVRITASGYHGLFTTDTSDHVGMCMYINENREVGVLAGSWQVTFRTGTLILMDTWHHIALIRYGTGLRIYVDGVLGAQATYADDSGDVGNELIFGKIPSQSMFLVGYLDEIRISKGIARYTTAFQPPVTAYIDDMLIRPALYSKYPVHWWKLDGDTITDNGSIPVNGIVSGAQRLNEVGHNYQPAYMFKGYDESYGDNITINAPPFSNGSLSCTMWVYLVPNASSDYCLINRQPINGAWYFFIEGEIIKLRGSSPGSDLAAGSISPYYCRWVHLAFTVTTGTTGAIYINGVQAASGTIIVINDMVDVFALELGAYDGGNIHAFNGMKRDIQLYNVALSAADIYSIYQHGGVVSDSSALFYYADLFTKHRVVAINILRGQSRLLPEVQQSLFDGDTRVISTRDF